MNEGRNRVAERAVQPMRKVSQDEKVGVRNKARVMDLHAKKMRAQ